MVYTTYNCVLDTLELLIYYKYIKLEHLKAKTFHSTMRHAVQSFITKKHHKIASSLTFCQYTRMLAAKNSLPIPPMCATASSASSAGQKAA